MRVFIGLESTDERQHLSRHAVFSGKRGKSQARNGLLPEVFDIRRRETDIAN